MFLVSEQECVFYLFIKPIIHKARHALFIVYPTSARLCFQEDSKLLIRETSKSLSKLCYQIVIMSILYAANHSQQSKHALFVLSRNVVYHNAVNLRRSGKHYDT